MQHLSPKRIAEFQTAVWQHYADYGRNDLPWRHSEPSGQFNAYNIMVSELMLQQTQVRRVIPKYNEFLKLFPDIQSLAAADLGDVIRAWQGLGYNRRAKYLHLAAQQIVGHYAGHMPQTLPDLITLPGIGKNTASAIMAYAYNAPVVFIETNIRTVIIHHFFPGAERVTEAEIAAVVEQTLPSHQSSREWYWALMDYGTMLKKTVGNLNALSTTYTKQSSFVGSTRQLRGRILSMLSSGQYSRAEVLAELNDDRTEAILTALSSEGLIRQIDDSYVL